MTWKNILKEDWKETHRDFDEELEVRRNQEYQDKTPYQNPVEVDSLLNKKQSGQGIMTFLADGRWNPKVNPVVEYNVLENWDIIITKIKQLYDKFNLSHSRYTGGIIRQGRFGVDNAALNMISNIAINPNNSEDLRQEAGKILRLISPALYNSVSRRK